MIRKPRVLVICTGNSMRSQMAEGVLRAELGNRIEVLSAGTHPASAVYPAVAHALTEIGADISKHYPKSVSQFADTELDLVITLCDHAHSVCPPFANAHKCVHHPYRDPIDNLYEYDEANLFARLRDAMRHELTAIVISELNLTTTN